MLGEAIQIKSDLDQLWNIPEGEGVDFLNKKKLYPVVLAMQKATPAEKRKLGDVYFKRVLESEDINVVREIVENIGSKKEAEDRFDACISEVEQILNKYNSNADLSSQIISFITNGSNGQL